MKITGSRWELQIEDDNGNVAGFSGEACPGEFLADAASLCWIRHKGEAAQGDGMDLIRKVTEYTKNSSCRVLFFDADQKILFEDELENTRSSVKDVSYFPGSGGGPSGVCGGFAYYAG